MILKINKLVSKNVTNFALGALVFGCVALSPSVARAEAVVEYIDTAAFSATMTNVLDEGIDDLRDMLIPLILAGTAGGIGVGIVSSMGKVVTKKVLGIARKA